MSDGDNQGLAARVRSMLGQVQPPRNLAERVVVLAPTWSIDTWALWLLGQETTEAQSYKRTPLEPDLDEIRSAGRMWPNPPRQNEQQRLPSLSAGRAEFLRL